MTFLWKSVVMLWLAGLLHALEDDEEEILEDEIDPEPLLGILDYVLLCGMVAFAVYWFLFREKKEDPSIPAYVIQPTQMMASASGGSSGGSFLDKMRNSKRRFVVFYGSQTGTAEEFAGRLAKEGTR